ncbi:MAG: hypothetical protein DRQ88_05895 [Epsilonproteobacteria bacterium]|nr:MAG: hypothetical protein DRQ88_05895 [Campylobacterota bacterium]
MKKVSFKDGTTQIVYSEADIMEFYKNPNDQFKFLQKHGLLDPSLTTPLGRIENNRGVIENQQPNAITSQREIATNSSDATLIKHCLLDGIDPKDKSKVPSNRQEAMEKWLGYKSSIEVKNDMTKFKKQREEFPLIMALGHLSKEGNPSIYSIDFGAGESYDQLENTFCSLMGSNKNEIPFSQGSYGQGGGGVLCFTKVKTIITRRHPKLRNSDPQSKYWCGSHQFYVEPVGDQLVGNYCYINFLIDVDGPLPLLPLTTSPTTLHYGKDLEYGTCILLPEYETKHKGTFSRNFMAEFCFWLPDPTMPLRFLDKRKVANPKKASGGRIAWGLDHILTTERKQAPGFPITVPKKVIDPSGKEYGEIEVTIYCLKDGKMKDNHVPVPYRVAFVAKGQTQYSLEKQWLKSADMLTLQDHVMIIVNCDGMNEKTLNKIFMANRSHMREVPATSAIKEALKDSVKYCEELIDFRAKIAEEKAKNKDTSSSMKKIANKIMRSLKSGDWLKSLLQGTSTAGAGEKKPSPIQTPYAGNYWPTEFIFTTKKSEWPINKKKALSFKTDVVNDYFALARNMDQGHIKVTLEGVPHNITPILSGGRMTVFLDKLPDNLIKIGSKVFVEVSIADRKRKWKHKIELTTAPEKIKKPDPGSELAEPNLIPVYKEDWDKWGFDGDSCFKVEAVPEAINIGLNLDNDLLSNNRYQAKTHKLTKGIIDEQYKSSMGTHALAMYHFLKKKEDSLAEEDQKTFDIAEITHIASKGLALSNPIVVEDFNFGSMSE